MFPAAESPKRSDGNDSWDELPFPIQVLLGLGFLVVHETITVFVINLLVAFERTQDDNEIVRHGISAAVLFCLRLLVSASLKKAFSLIL